MSSGCQELSKTIELVAVLLLFSSCLLISEVSAENVTTNHDATASEKPSLAESNPLVIVVFLVGGSVGVVISIFALRALLRARQFEE